MSFKERNWNSRWQGNKQEMEISSKPKDLTQRLFTGIHSYYFRDHYHLTLGYCKGP